MSRDAHLSIRISREKKEALERLASRRELSAGQLVRRAVDGLLGDRVGEDVQVYGVRDGAPDPNRTRELDWLDSHREELASLAGQWLVLEGDRLVAHGRDYDQVVEEARRQGVRVPFMEWIPPGREEGAWMGL